MNEDLKLNQAALSDDDLEFVSGGSADMDRKIEQLSGMDIETWHARQDKMVEKHYAEKKKEQQTSSVPDFTFESVDMTPVNPDDFKIDLSGIM